MPTQGLASGDLGLQLAKGLLCILSQMPGPTVLISDDEPFIISSFQRAAQLHGLRVISDTGSDVFQLALEHAPDVIVLDVHQRVDGRDLLARLKRDERTAHLPVVVLSGIEDHFMRHLCLELGAAEYVLKPFDPGFMRRVARLAEAASEEAPTVH